MYTEPARYLRRVFKYTPRGLCAVNVFLQRATSSVIHNAICVIYEQCIALLFPYTLMHLWRSVIIIDSGYSWKKDIGKFRLHQKKPHCQFYQNELNRERVLRSIYEGFYTPTWLCLADVNNAAHHCQCAAWSEIVSRVVNYFATIRNDGFDSSSSL
jgi:hypothetical protein